MPDDDQADLRIWATCDPVFESLVQRLGLEVDPIPVWGTRCASLHKIPAHIHPYCKKKAQLLEEVARRAKSS